MFSAKEYRAKAAEYAERGRTAEAPNEVLEYKNLGRRSGHCEIQKTGRVKPPHVRCQEARH
jgi:hypothetical protein